MEQKFRTGNKTLLAILIVERLVNYARSSTALDQGSGSSRACGNLYFHTGFKGFSYE